MLPSENDTGSGFKLPFWRLYQTGHLEPLYVADVPEADLTHRLGLRKLPAAVENLGAWAIEPHRVVPTRHGHEAVRNFAVAAAKLDVDRTVGVLGGSDVIQRL